MPKMKGYIGAMLPLMMMLDEMNKIDEGICSEDKPSNKLKPDDITISYQQRKPPKGCKEYFFNEAGDFYNGEGRPMLKSETVFYCHAINDKSAKSKFKRWKMNRIV